MIDEDETRVPHEYFATVISHDLFMLLALLSFSLYGKLVFVIFFLHFLPETFLFTTIANKMKARFKCL